MPYQPDGNWCRFGTLRPAHLSYSANALIQRQWVIELANFGRRYQCGDGRSCLGLVQPEVAVRR